jgi:hypothetical protein
MTLISQGFYELSITFKLVLNSSLEKVEQEFYLRFS